MEPPISMVISYTGYAKVLHHFLQVWVISYTGYAKVLGFTSITITQYSVGYT